MNARSSGQQQFCWLSTIILFWGLAMQAVAQESERVDRLTRQWLDTERQITRLQSDWRAQQPVLEQRVTLLTAEKEQLQQILKESSNSQSDVDARRAELLAEQATLEQQQAEIAQALEALQARLAAVSTLLPPPLQQDWQNEQSSLGDNPDTSLKLQVALAQLSRVADFDQRVSVNQSPIQIPQGETVQVKQLYLGVGMAWFASADGQIAGWGQANDEGWQWHVDEHVDGGEINAAIAMFERRQQAEIVRLPVYLHAGGQP